MRSAAWPTCSSCWAQALREFAAKLFGATAINHSQETSHERAYQSQRGSDSDTDRLPIAVRAFAPAASEAEQLNRSASAARAKPAPPSEWTLVFDTETTVDAAQRLRIGAYQLRKGDALDEAGLFYDPAALSRSGAGRSSSASRTTMA